MARRFASAYQSEPMSALATWGRRLAVFSLVAALLSIAIIRFGFLEFRPALATFFGALGLAGLSIVICFTAFIAIWHNGSRGMGRILVALLLNTAILAYPAYLAWQYQKLPPIHDITTDPIDPPKFEALARLRAGEDTNPVAYAGLYSAERQRVAYPDIEPMMLETPPQKTYEIALALINKRKWLVVDARAPQLPRREGKIEAIARTPIMGFREDISLRVLPDGAGSKVDMRSSSRYFQHDLGSNAARLAKLIEEINEASESASLAPAKPPTPAKGTQAKGAVKR
jgi:uncharacterized protein (DUF1499 family)